MDNGDMPIMEIGISEQTLERIDEFEKMYRSKTLIGKPWEDLKMQAVLTCNSLSLDLARANRLNTIGNKE